MQRREWHHGSDGEPQGDRLPLRVFVRGRFPEFAQRVESVLSASARFRVDRVSDGAVIATVWQADLDEVFRLLDEAGLRDLDWGAPQINYLHETVASAHGGTRDITYEPILNVAVSTPEARSGTVMGDLSSRRGQITGLYDERDGRKVIHAEVPLSELSGYGKALHATTDGSAIASAEFNRYSEAPRNLDPDPKFPMSAALRA